MELINQREIDQFNDWLDQWGLGHEMVPPEGIAGLTSTAVWLNSQGMTVHCPARLERNIQAQVKAARAGVFLVPHTLSPLNSIPVNNPNGNSRWTDAHLFARVIAATTILLPLLLLVFRQFNPANDPQSIPAPSVGVVQIATPDTQEDALGLLLFPNLLVFSDESESSTITVWAAGETLDVTLANRSGETAVYSLPSLDLTQQIDAGSVIHLEIGHPPSNTPFEVRFPASPENDYTGTLVVKLAPLTATPQAGVMSHY